MSNIGRQLRPMLKGTWTTPPRHGRRRFRIGGFLIGLLLGVGIFLPAAGLIMDSGSSLAATGTQAERLSAPAPVTLATVSSPADRPSTPAAQRPQAAPATARAPRPAEPETPAPQAQTPRPEAEADQPATGRTIKLRMRVTAYCPCSRCCGRFADGKTACGKPVWTNGARFVAAPKWVPFGAKVRVPGYFEAIAVPVLDRGGDIYGHRLDVFFLSHEVAKQWGMQYLDVIIEMP
jgi:3D (Asp-Asp-Asp) domain-containing protein